MPLVGFTFILQQLDLAGNAILPHPMSAGKTIPGSSTTGVAQKD